MSYNKPEDILRWISTPNRTDQVMHTNDIDGRERFVINGIRPIEIIVSIAASLMILGGASYAHNRETLRSSLGARFERINTEYFQGQLAVQLMWGSLVDAYGESTDGAIVIDTWSVTTASQLDAALQHEACHIFSGIENQHNEIWQSCMTRFTGAQ